MRRILAGIISGGAGAVAWSAVSVYTGPSRLALAAAIAVTLGAYGAIDSLGLLPPPFEVSVRSILYADETSDNGGE
jgi:hypothetical protein